MTSDIRFFGRRHGKKLGHTKQDLLKELLPKFAWQKQTPLKLNFNKVVLEIGFGDGEHIYYKACQNPKSYFIGCEPFVNGVANLLTLCHTNEDTHQLKNLLIFNDDVTLLLKDSSFCKIDEVYILFPDPWHKKKHNKRRIFNQAFLNQICNHLNPRAKIFFASDNEEYAKQVLDILKFHSNFQMHCNLLQDLQLPFYQDFQTKYEKRATRLKHKCFYIQALYTAANV